MGIIDGIRESLGGTDKKATSALEQADNREPTDMGPCTECDDGTMISYRNIKKFDIEVGEKAGTDVNLQAGMENTGTEIEANAENRTNIKGEYQSRTVCDECNAELDAERDMKQEAFNNNSPEVSELDTKAGTEASESETNLETETDVNQDLEL